MATHSFVTMPVVSHSHKRKKCDMMGCNSSARWAWDRCRKIVTPAMVIWVITNAASTICHQLAPSSPWASRFTTVSCIDQKISILHPLCRDSANPNIVGADRPLVALDPARSRGRLTFTGQEKD